MFMGHLWAIFVKEISDGQEICNLRVPGPKIKGSEVCKTGGESANYGIV